MGLILSGLVIMTWQKGPSREEVINRARDYGMVFREEVLPLEPGTGASKNNHRSEIQEEIQEGKNPRGGEVQVTVPPGSSSDAIARLLEDKGVIEASVFEAEIRRRGMERRLKAGSFLLPLGDVEGIIERLVN